MGKTGYIGFANDRACCNEEFFTFQFCPIIELNRRAREVGPVRGPDTPTRQRSSAVGSAAVLPWTAGVVSAFARCVSQ